MQRESSKITATAAATKKNPEMKRKVRSLILEPPLTPARRLPILIGQGMLFSIPRRGSRRRTRSGDGREAAARRCARTCRRSGRSGLGSERCLRGDTDSAEAWNIAAGQYTLPRRHGIECRIGRAQRAIGRRADVAR